MNKFKLFKISSLKSIYYILLLGLGILLGRVFFHPSGHIEDKHIHESESTENTVWTCSMHPQIKMSDPGKCPICGMDLIPLVSGTSSQIDHHSIHLTKEAAELANVLTTKVMKQNPVKEVRVYGKVQLDERLLQSQVSHVSGRIEKLFVNFTGERIKKGQKLAEIYSAELISSSQELLETSKTKGLHPELYEASKEKLRQWKLTDAQIESIEKSGLITTNFEILSNTSGTVTTRRVSTGDYISRGGILFDIADLSKVWILFYAYESDLPFIRQGEKVKFNIQAIPGKEFSGRVIFIDPIIDPMTRVAKIRVEADNSSGLLKPEMFATGIISSNMNDYSGHIIVPKSAVLWTGKRSIVYVKEPGEDEPVFKLREIELGPILEDSYIVIAGLNEGEEIVSHGTFSVDASAQLEGKLSMMNTHETPMYYRSQQENENIRGFHQNDVIYNNITKIFSDENHSDASISAEIKHDRDQAFNEVPISTDIHERKAVNRNFVRQLTFVTDHYLQLKNSLVHDDLKKAQEAAKSMQEAMSRVDHNLLTASDHQKWMELSKSISQNLSPALETRDIAEIRKFFKEISDKLYIAVKTYGLTGKTVYYQYCPMADNDKGAFWLSESEEILNPYFGDEMLNCGELKEKLSF